MKDNKYAPYILGPILLLIWGLVFYKIYQAVYGGEDNFTVPSFQPLPVFDGPQQDSSFALLLDYKDPFFGKNFSSNNRSKSNYSSHSKPKNTGPKRPKTIAPTVVPTPAIIPSKPFPPIHYQGFQIMESDTIAALKINKQFIPLARKGQVIKGVQVRGIFPDSIQLLFDGQAKTFLRARR